MHWVTNISKTLMDMISPRYNQAYKYVGNEDEYPFVLSNNAIDIMRDAVNSSRHLIPSAAFKSSFYGYDPQRSKSIYRSADYIDWLLYVLPLYAPLFDDKRVADGISCLVRGISLALQFSISEDELQEIQDNFEAWFIVLDRLIQRNNCIHTSIASPA